MNWFNGVLGLVVLTGPLLLFFIWIPICLIIALRVAKQFKGPAKTIVGGLVVFTLMLIIPLSDEIVGRFYLAYLCSTEAGVNVYQTVELPAEYWDETGKPKFQVYDADRSDTARFYMGESYWDDERFTYRRFTESYSPLLNIDMAGIRLSEKESEKVLGEIVYFRFWGGWISRNLSTHNSSNTCELKNLDDWHYLVFKSSEDL